MRKSVIISIVYPPTTPAFSHPSFPEGGELEILSPFWGIPSLLGEMPSPLLKPPSPFIISLISFFIIPYINLYH